MGKWRKISTAKAKWTLPGALPATSGIYAVYLTPRGEEYSVLKYIGSSSNLRRRWRGYLATRRKWPSDGSIPGRFTMAGAWADMTVKFRPCPEMQRLESERRLIARLGPTMNITNNPCKARGWDWFSSEPTTARPFRAPGARRTKCP